MSYMRRIAAKTVLTVMLLAVVGYWWTHRVGRYQVTPLDRDGVHYVVLDTTTGRHWVRRGSVERDDTGKEQVVWQIQFAGGPTHWWYRLFSKETPGD